MLTKNQKKKKGGGGLIRNLRTWTDVFFIAGIASTDFGFRLTSRRIKI